jgi:hypothetical protein
MLNRRLCCQQTPKPSSIKLSTSHQLANSADIHQSQASIIGATSQQPPATSYQPPTTNHQPPTTISYQPPATSHHWAPVTVQPVASNSLSKPSAINQQPAVIYHQPPATSHEPPATSHQPPATSHQPSATSQLPSSRRGWLHAALIYNLKQTSNNHKPTAAQA